jgi:hypothetical protein
MKKRIPLGLAVFILLQGAGLALLNDGLALFSGSNLPILLLRFVYIVQLILCLGHLFSFIFSGRMLGGNNG